MRGAKYVRIYSKPQTDPARRRGGFREAVVLAWSRTPAGNRSALLAWAGWCRSQTGQGTEHARYGWVLYDERMLPTRPTSPQLPGEFA